MKAPSLEHIKAKQSRGKSIILPIGYSYLFLLNKSRPGRGGELWGLLVVFALVWGLVGVWGLPPGVTGGGVLAHGGVVGSDGVRGF